MTLALDGHGHGTLATGSTFSVSLTTTGGSGQIVVCIGTNNTTNPSITSVTAAGLTFLQRTNFFSGSGWTSMNTWVAPYTSNFSGSITITANGTQAVTADVFGISGADTTASVTAGSPPFDSNAALPAHSASGNVTGQHTSSANTFIFSAVSVSAASDPGGAGAGWTALPGSNANFLLVQYQIVSSTQTGLTSATATSADDKGSILDAIIAGSGGGGGSPVLLPNRRIFVRR
jgi:hypothetical protein